MVLSTGVMIRFRNKTPFQGLCLTEEIKPGVRVWFAVGRDATIQYPVA